MMTDEIDLSMRQRESDDVSEKSSYISLGAPSVHEGDIERREEFGGWYLIGLAYKATGVIYGDIGTSPLYVYSSTFSSNPSYDDLLGVLSIIIWTLTLLVTVKYVVFVLHADDQGGGGILALYSLLRRYARIDGSARPDHDERFPGSEMRRSNRYIRRKLEESPTAHAILQFAAILGFCLMVADGALTPAQSVLGSIQGLNIWWPSLDSSSVVIITCVILALLFIVQFKGTGRLAHLFAPVIIIWFLLNIAFGIYNLICQDASVLRAFSPYFAGHYFVRQKTNAWKSLGGVLLAFTGVEAMYANLGAFSKRAIRISWLCLGYPSLLLAYTGQAAYISNNPSAYANPFFNSVPPGTYWPALVISILATIVASQALITGTFQLISQAMKLSCFPEVNFRHTSGRIHGQIYIPLANWLLALGTILVVIVYHNTTMLGRAYGTCVAMIVFLTTCMVSLIAIIVWKIHPLLVFPIFISFACLDGLYLSSALTKIPNGAWFTLMVALLLTFLVYIWRFGKDQQEEVPDPNARLKWGDPRLLTLQGVGIFVEKAGERSDRILTRFRRKFNARHEVTVIFHLIPVPKPKVDPDDEYRIDRVPSQPNTYRIVVRRGFDDTGLGPDLGSMIHDRLRNHISGRISRDIFNRTQDGFQESDLSTLETAFNSQIVYIVGKQHYKIRPSTKGLRRLALEVFVWLQSLSGSEFSELENYVGGDIFEIRIVQDI